MSTETGATILAGDVGGTSTRLAVYAIEGRRLQRGVERTFPSLGHVSLDEIVAAFVADLPRWPTHACFGIAGPVRDGRCATTNLPWVVEEAALRRDLGLKRAWLINDLEATGWGIAALGPDAVATLHEGAPDAVGNAAVIAAGTGLGEAGMYWDGARHQPFATEGGHADFGPADEEQEALAGFLRRRHGRVSWERVVSGPGLAAIHEFLRERGHVEEEAVAAEVAAGDAAAAISRAALAGRSPLCARALDLFVRLYGAETGNLALKLMARGGVWVTGGIAPKILPRLADGTFVAAFLAKGRMRPVLDAIPVRVVLDERVGLLGAARCAAVRDGLLGSGEAT